MGLTQIIVILVYLLALGYLSWLGHRQTKTAADYLIAGRQVHPFVMAMSYGATFISTSSLIGFGGVAGLFGMSLLWLTFLNIFVGIFIAFVCLGSPTRRMGHHLDAHTFPEFLGRRYQSKFIQVFAGLVIFLFIPLYAAAVLIGGCEALSQALGIDYTTALLVFSVIVAAYVIVGGLKAVMYTEALQGTIMAVGMIILLVATYWMLGGVTEAHKSLTEMSDLVPAHLKSIGHTGWTSMPKFGWGGHQYDLWWIVVSTIMLGVGIGVLAQPQLAVRLMTVNSKKQLNRAVLIGALFILIMPGTTYTVGSLSNVYFAKQENPPVLMGKVIQTIDADQNYVKVERYQQNEDGEWKALKTEDGKQVTTNILLADQQPYEDVLVGSGDNASPIQVGRAIAVDRAGKADAIIPTYLSSAMPPWFGMLFTLVLLSAAMSTLASQFHALGTSIGRDVFEQVTPKRKEISSKASILITRLGIAVGLILAVILSAQLRGGYIIARATAIFFGLCASTFLPAYIGGLFFKRITRAGAIASMVVGFTVTAFWLTFVKSAEAKAIGLVQHLTGGKGSILADVPNWYVVDPLVVALPLAIIVAVVVSLATRPLPEEHIEKCFAKSAKKA